MPRYKTGDRVRVRADLDFENNGYYGVFGPNKLGCLKDMAVYKGHVITVKETPISGCGDWFSCNENSWTWCEEMVTPLNQKIISLTNKDIESIKASSDAFFDLL